MASIECGLLKYNETVLYNIKTMLCYRNYTLLFEKLRNITRAITYLFYIYTFSNLADAFIESDLQMRTTEAINCSIKTSKNRSKTKN